MNLKNYYYYFQSALTPKICDDILAYGKSHQAEMAVTGGVSRNVETVANYLKKKSITYNEKENLTLFG